MHNQKEKPAMSEDAAKMQVGSAAFGPPNPDANTFEGMMARLMLTVLPDPQTNERPTLRDLFAMAVVTGLLANPNNHGNAAAGFGKAVWRLTDEALQARGQ
jgi:hypothetical protein